MAAVFRRGRDGCLAAPRGPGVRDPAAGAGRRVTFDLPRGGAVPTDVAVGSDGSVWFLQFRANRIGRFKDDRRCLRPRRSCSPGQAISGFPQPAVPG